MPRADFFDPAVSSALRARFERLQVDTPRRWGTMDASAMVEHLNRAMDMALGLSDDPRERGLMAMLLRQGPLKNFVIGSMPWPKSLPTAPSMAVVTEISDADGALFNERRSDCIRRWEEMLAFPAEQPMGDHALFGTMSRRDWGLLFAKHLDHHLRQFGL